MKPKIGMICVLVASVTCALVSADNALAALAPVIPYPKTSRIVADEWVREINEGNRRGACELQSVAEAEGLACAELPPNYALKCPAGDSVHTRTRPEVRSLPEQIGTITEEGPNLVYAELLAQKRSSKQQGALGLELVGGQWKVTYLRQGSETFTHAGDVWNTESWRKLWYPATCERRKRVLPTG